MTTAKQGNAEHRGPDHKGVVRDCIQEWHFCGARDTGESMGIELRLTDGETNTLAECEAVIDRGLATFVDVGNALLHIRDSRLYRDGFGTFEAYCQERWGMSKTNANRLIGAAEVVGNLAPIGVIPTSESVARPLTALEPEEQREVWRQAVAEGVPTAATVEAIVTGRLAPLMTSASPDWQTPPDVIERVVRVLGEIDLDPCCNEGEPNVPARQHYRKADDGLDQPWVGRVYMNPPYGDEIGGWVTKLHLEHQLERRTSGAIALVPARVDTRWWRILRDYPVCFIEGRLKFSGSDTSAPFPSAVFYLGTEVQRFVTVFGGIGDVYQRIS